MEIARIGFDQGSQQSLNTRRLQEPWDHAAGISIASQFPNSSLAEIPSGLTGYTIHQKSQKKSEPQS